MSVFYTLLAVWLVVFGGLEVRGLLEGKVKDVKFHLSSLGWFLSYFYDVGKLIVERIKQRQ